MRKDLLLLLVASAVFIVSCSKEDENRLLGTWQIEKAWRVVFSGQEYFQTGYENGVFIFESDGVASYVENRDTVHGYWSSDLHTMTYYDTNTRALEKKEMRYLRIRLVDYLQNQSALEFHDFHFENNFDKIRAAQHNVSENRIYLLGRRNL